MQDRPDNFQLPDHIKVTKLDYFGQPYEAYERINRLPDYGKLWKRFSEDFRNQDMKDTAGRSGCYSPNLEQIEYKEINSSNGA